MYVRKTVDRYAIEGNCGYGWDLECMAEDYTDAKRLLKEYIEKIAAIRLESANLEKRNRR